MAIFFALDGGAKFQFPPNGKAHGKTSVLERGRIMDVSFNSLRTGRHMESKTEYYQNLMPKYMVSIPSEREGTWKV